MSCIQIDWFGHSLVKNYKNKRAQGPSCIDAIAELLIYSFVPIARVIDLLHLQACLNLPDMGVDIETEANA